MRAAVAIISFALFVVAGCNTLREAGEVAVRLAKKPTAEQINAAIKDQGGQNAELQAKLAKLQASGRKATDAELKALVNEALTGQTSKAKEISKAPKPPPDQEISVNLIYSGLQPTDSGKNLDFDFKALWGDFKETNQQISVPSRVGKGEARLNLDVAKMRVTPKIVSSTKGKYELELTDPAGNLIGRFDIRESGKQVDMLGKPSKYSTELIYYHPERRLTGYAVYKPGSRKPELGVIFVGKGWEYVEKSKKADMTKGYVFPEIDMVVLPKAWLIDNDYQMKETCNTLKRGTTRLGGVCYS